MTIKKQLDLSLALSEFEAKIKMYIDHIKADYHATVKRRSGGILDQIDLEIIEEFNQSVYVDVLSKYYRVVSKGCVHSFIVRFSDDKFKSGDVLKAASFHGPARNFARANIMDGNYMNIKWVGA